jgi:hypothetical protein
MASGFNFQRSARNRLVVGGVFGVIACIVLLKESHPILGFLALLLGLISSVRAILNRAPIAGLLLLKANGFFLLMYPFLWAASDKFWGEKERLGITHAQVQTIETHADLVNLGLADPTPTETIHERKDLVQHQPTPNPQRTVEPLALSEKDEIFLFVRNARKLEEGTNLDLVMNQYAKEVDYFDRKLNRSEIREDKRKYWEKWPKRKEGITSKIMFEKPRYLTFKVTFSSSFRNENPESGEWFSADLLNVYLLERIGGKYFIIGQSCKASNLQKGNLEKPNTGRILHIVTGGVRVIISEDLASKIVFKGHKDDRARAYQAVNGVSQMLQAETKRDLQKTMASFAFMVRYFDQDISSEQITMDKKAYFEKWPRASDTLISKYTVEIDSKGVVTVKLTTRFEAINAASNLSRTGEIDHTFKLITWHNGNELRINEQSGKVRNLKTRKIK